MIGKRRVMKTVCEIVVNDVLPTLRAAVAKELIKSYNLNQSEVAKLLDVSQPAVSQYLRQLRGRSGMVEDERVSAHIKDLAGKLHSKQISTEELCVKMCDVSKVIIDAGLLKDIVGIKKVDTCAVCKS
jgi:predicted transcriptional regulator